MSYEKVSQATNVIVGTKQTVRALKNENVKEVIIASDADSRIQRNIIQLATEMEVPYYMVDSMKELGECCGIEVGAATVAIIQ